jgi:hypothetical protein
MAIGPERNTRRILLRGCLLLLPLSLATTARAQNVCYPGPESNEANTFAAMSVPLAFGPGGTIGEDPVARFWVGLEGTFLPNIDSATTVPTVCRPGKEGENTDFSPAFGRLRAGVALLSWLDLEIGWVPPIRVDGVKANLVSVALGGRVAIGHGSLAIRGHATVGEILAPVTCDEEALTDPASECFGGQLSEDSYKPNIFGIDGTFAFPLGSKFRPYLGAGYNRLQPRFQVNFTNRVGVTDNQKVEVDLNRLALFGGITWLPSRRWGITGEVYSQPADAVTVRVIGRFGIGN